MRKSINSSTKKKKISGGMSYRNQKLVLYGKNHQLYPAKPTSRSDKSINMNNDDQENEVDQMKHLVVGLNNEDNTNKNDTNDNVANKAAANNIAANNDTGGNETEDLDPKLEVGGQQPTEGITYTNPNLYLKDDPTKKDYVDLSANINYTHVIITRFSYRFVKNSPIGKLFDARRMKRRFQLLEAFCLPSIINQTNKNFYWVLIVDRELPQQYLERLYQLIARYYESPDYKKHGPRQIFVYKWEYKYNMSSVEWLREIIPQLDEKKYLITTRLDDDDSLCQNFTNMVKDQLARTRIQGFYLITFEYGYYWYPNPRLKYGVYKVTTKPWIAIGLTLITNLQKYPFTVYFGNHTKLVHYIRDYKNHKLLKRMCDKNGEPVTDRNYKDKYAIVKRTAPVFIRTIHDQNLQRGMKNIFKNSKVGTKLMDQGVHNLGQIAKGFKLNAKKVEKVNIKI